MRIMALLLLRYPVVNSNPGENVLESLSFEARGEASNPPTPTVLSCGGLFFRRDQLPERRLTWREIVQIPGPESNRLFGFFPVKIDPIELTFGDTAGH